MINILAISGSLKSTSSNTAIVKAIAGLSPANVQISLYEGLGDLPHFSPDIDGGKSAESVVHFRKLLQEAQGIIICTPEYAFGMPGVLKNALDWTVSSGELTGKPAAAISASPLYSGGENAHASLMLTLKALSSKVAEKSQLQIPSVYGKFDPEGNVSDEKTKQSLIIVIDSLLQTIENQ